MINPISNQLKSISLQSPAKPAKTEAPAAKLASRPTVDSPRTEATETASAEALETSAQKSAEALKSLASRESAQMPSTTPKTVIAAQTAKAAYARSS